MKILKIMQKILLLILMTIPFISFSQDTIITNKGKKIVCKIDKIDKETIYFKKSEKKKVKGISISEVKYYTPQKKEAKPTQEYEVNMLLQLPYVGEKVIYSRKIKLGNDAVNVQFEKFKKYLNEKEDSLSKVFKNENIQTGKLTAKATLRSNYETFYGTETSTISFTLAFTASDKESIVELKDIYIQSKKSSALIEVWDAHSGEFFHSQLEVLDVQFKAILDNIEKKLKTY